MKIKQPTFEGLSAKEWIVTNGLGGYAAGTLSGANTRRYHGLLVAALNPPTDRTVLVSKIEESIGNEDGSWTELSSNQYPGAVHPEGFQYLSAFERAPMPRFTYQAGKRKLIKEICMVYGQNTTMVSYSNNGKTAYTLRLRPFLVHRDYHSLYHEDAAHNYWIDWQGPKRAMVYAYYGARPLHVAFTQGQFTRDAQWYRKFEYAKETYRGLDDHEDCFTPGMIETTLMPGQSVHVLFSTDPLPEDIQPEMIRNTFLQHQESIGAEASVTQVMRTLQKISDADESDLARWYLDLAVAGDQFIVQRASSEGKTVIAGYHWFTDWGRDTMIAMRGLVISQGRKSVAESIIRTFLKYLDRGMLPNRFPDSGETPEYNTMDATLWLFVVLHEYYERFEDLAFISEVYPSLEAVIAAHVGGTRYGIHMTESGLLFGGEGLNQLTWMDARVGDVVVTPRHGCPVEINALWYNALRIADQFAVLLGKDPVHVSLAEQVRESFARHYFNGAYLNDVVIPGEYVDDSIRPNQIYALSLPYPLLDRVTGQRVLDVVQEKLLTPLGLRSMDPMHADFVPIYEGDPWHRDHAYHQGTVWAFLLGEYWLAWLRQNQFSKSSCTAIIDMLDPMMKHFYKNDCIHGISEIFDGATPGAGRGCVHQAWSIGMMLKVLTDVADHMRKPVSRKKMRA